MISETDKMNFQVRSFGGLSFSRDGHIYFPAFGRVIAELFAYLCANHNRIVFRDALAERLWPEKPLEQSRSALNTSLWRLDKALKSYSPEGLVALIRRPDSVSLCVQNADDVFDFENLRRCVLEMEAEMDLSASPPPKTISRWIAALDHYCGSFHPNLDSHWILQDRERFRCLYIRGCQFMMQYFTETHRFELALSYGRKILKLDELRESTQRQVIWLYVMNGQRHKAHAQAKALTQLLRKELDVEPMPETVELFSLIGQPDSSVVKLRPALKDGHDVTSSLALKTADRATIFRSLSLMV